MTHGKIFQFGASTAYQYCTGIDQTTQICGKDGYGVGSSIRYLQAPSISLCTRSRAHWETDPDSGDKDRFYGQAIPGADPGASAICEIHWPDLKRDSHTSSGSFSPQGSWAWLGGGNPLERSIWNTVLTGCQPTRLPKLISSWYPGRSGQRVIQTDV